MDLSTFPIAFAEAREYLHELDGLRSDEWHDSLRNVLALPRATPKAYALLHPDWLELNFNAGTVQRLLGPARFDQTRLDPELASCHAKLIWGYECDIPSSTPLEADHLFPRSLGGASEAGNRVWLCRRHNAIKTNDVHLYPSWGDWKPWLRRALGNRLLVADRMLRR
ncbi:HNH endonuclease [Agrococcus sp. KRD186]|uniref:HNH endonuclease n=1 Tax=Agrococcus sp. KRD186 TaxID=2729730 RepID=UPI0019D255BD|nr:HNH endonuclease signature motif containing protein [Agrococcus sp. KRD186]